LSQEYPDIRQDSRSNSSGTFWDPPRLRLVGFDAARSRKFRPEDISALKLSAAPDEAYCNPESSINMIDWCGL